MNPFLYPALIVVCACSLLTRQVAANTANTDARSTAAVGSSLAAIAACMLGSIGLASLTGTGTRGAIVTTVLLVSCVACVMFLIVNSERNARLKKRRAAVMTRGE